MLVLVVFENVWCPSFQVSEIFYMFSQRICLCSSDCLQVIKGILALRLFRTQRTNSCPFELGAWDPAETSDGQGSTNHNSRSTNQCISMISSTKNERKDYCERNQGLIEEWLYGVRGIYAQSGKQRSKTVKSPRRELR